MKKQSLSKNFAFQFLYQGLILIIPLVLSPYLTRTLQEKALGIYSYTNSIAYYFVVVAMLGISRYGQRIVSQSSDNSKELGKQFWSLFSVHVVGSIVVLIAYILFVCLFINEDIVIYYIQAFYVFSALFDITWLFYGLENFKSVVIKNAIVKFCECALIFIFVKTSNDLWIYTVITTVGVLLGQIVMLPQAFRMIPFEKFSFEDAMKHIKPLLVFSISVIAVSLYTVFDKTLLGILSNKEDVAFYEYSNRIITIPKTIIGVVGTVMFPRACKMASKGDVIGQKKYINYSFIITSCIGVGAIFGLFSISKIFAVVYFGKSFEICGNVIIMLAPLIYIIGIGDIIRTQYMIPNHMDKQFNFCIIINAVVNIILSISLIPVIGIYGAAIGTVAAELFGIVYQMILCRKFISVKDIFFTSLPFIFIGLVMFFVLKIEQLFLQSGARDLIVEVLTGGCVYIILTIVYLYLVKRDLLLQLIKR